MEQILGTTPEHETTNARQGDKHFVFQQISRIPETTKESETECQAGFGSCFSEIDTGASFLVIKFIAA